MEEEEVYRGFGLGETRIAPVPGSRVNVFWRTLGLIDGYVGASGARCAAWRALVIKEEEVYMGLGLWETR